MKMMILPMLLALSACGATDYVAPISAVAPAAIANHTIADELARRGAEQSYKLSRSLMEMAVDSGGLKGSAAAKAAKIDKDAYAALTAVRTAYDAFNSKDLFSAAAKVSSLVDQVQAIVKGNAK